MADLNTVRKNIYSLFSERGVDFLIPDYQRNYSWNRDHCEQLWTDFYEFAFPENDFDDDHDEYFLGTILTFGNNYKQKEVIDGQQRLITLMLLLRAFYNSFGENQNQICYKISECIWRIDKHDNPIKNQFKIKSEVASDEDIAEFEKIVTEGIATRGNKSHYAENYRFFQRKIEEFKNSAPDNFSDLPRRILQNCMVLLIEAESQNTALKIFTTLNDRGMPLSDSDIFKAQFYKFFNRSKQEKEKFVERWKEIEELCNKNFHPRTGTPLDDLFMRYMYYLLAKSGTKSDTFKGLRPYYEKNNYKILRDEKTFEDLIILVNFWNDIAIRDEKRFSNDVLKKIFILNYSPYSIWTNIVSLYFMGNKNSENKLEDKSFCKFLEKITALFLVNAVISGGTHNIRRPFFIEFQNILHGRELMFKDFRQDKRFFREQLENIKFSNTKSLTRALLAWWTFKDDYQKLPPIDTHLDIEHIYAKKRNEFEPLKNAENLEKLGNKSFLERRINIRAADYRFADKKKFYLGNGKDNPGTDILELRYLAESKNNFTESDILERNEKIFSAFMEYVAQNNLFK